MGCFGLSESIEDDFSRDFVEEALVDAGVDPLKVTEEVSFPEIASCKDRWGFRRKDFDALLL